MRLLELGVNNVLDDAWHTNYKLYYIKQLTFTVCPERIAPKTVKERVPERRPGRFGYHFAVVESASCPRV